MIVDVSLVVFALEFALAYLVDSIAAMIFFHHRGVPLYIAYPVMIATTYTTMYMVYSGIWELIGRIISFSAKKFWSGKVQDAGSLHCLGRKLIRTPALRVLLWTGEKIKIGGRWIAERHPAFVLIAFTLTPLPHSTNAVVLGLKLAKPKRVVPLLVALNFSRTTFWVMAVYYFPVLLEFQW